MSSDYLAGQDHTTIRRVCVGVLCGLLAVAMSVNTTIAQPRAMVAKTLQTTGERFFGDAYVIPGNTPDSASIVVMFRFANDFLTFTKASQRASVRGSYMAPVAVSIEVQDSMGVIRQRHRWADTLYTNTFDETNSATTFHCGWQTIPVPHGVYTITVEILSNRTTQGNEIVLKDIKSNDPVQSRLLSAPLFAQPLPSKEKFLLRPYVFSGNLRFGSSDGIALIVLSDTKPVEYDYAIVQKPYRARDIRWWQVSDVQGQVTSSTSRQLRISDFANSRDPYLEVVDHAPTGNAVALAEINIPLTTMVPGNYELQLVANGSRDTIAIPFRVEWEEMPRSLRNLDYAMSILKYIVKQEQLDSLNSGNDVERREHLMDWWRRQDPTPTTTYNERMVEYYKRVDEAFTTFSTIQEPDGANSERGKIYILFGPTSTTDKNLSPENAPQEIWAYTNAVKKKFFFSMDERGLYKLKSMEDLK